MANKENIPVRFNYHHPSARGDQAWQKPQDDHPGNGGAGPSSDRKAGARVKVLYFTEQLEEVFLLGEDTPQVTRRRQLCQEVLDKPEDPEVWWRLLRHVSDVFSRSKSHSAQIRKLYRKATMVIPKDAYNDNEAYTRIWLGHAIAEMSIGADDAREAFKYMKMAGIGNHFSVFYTAWALFEERQGNLVDAEAILHDGLKSNAEPRQYLSSNLDRIHRAIQGRHHHRPAVEGSSLPRTDDEATIQRDPLASGASQDGVGGRLGMPRAQGPTSDSDSDDTDEVCLQDADRTDVLPAHSPSTNSLLGNALTPSQDLEESPGQKVVSFKLGGAAATQLVVVEEEEEEDDSTKGGVPESSLPDGRGTHSGVITFINHDPSQRPEPMTIRAKKKSSGSNATDGAAPRPCGPPPVAVTKDPKPSPPSAAASTTPGHSCNQNTAPSAPSSANRLKRLQPTRGIGKPMRVPMTSSTNNKGPPNEVSKPTTPLALNSKGAPQHDDHVHGPSDRPSPVPPATNSVSASASSAVGSSSYFKVGRLQPIREDQTPSSCGSLKSPGPSQTPTATASHNPQEAVAKIRFKDIKYMYDIDFKHQRPQAPTSQEGQGDGGGGDVDAEPKLPQLQATPTPDARPENSNAYCSSLTASSSTSTSGSSSCALSYHHQHEGEQSLTRSRRATPPTDDKCSPPPAHDEGGSNHGDGYGDRTSNASSQRSVKSASQRGGPSFANLTNPKNFVSLNSVDYVKLDVLGRGGSSKVFRVLSENGQVYALKRVRVNKGDENALDSFANEITLLVRLKGHPSIISLVDHVVDRRTGVVHMLMEIGEVDLNRLLQDTAQEGQGQLSLNFIRYTWEQMLHAVHCIHEERIVHGDLKPANFVFVRGRLKLIDFGIAKAIGNDTTNIVRESQVGTVNYMSPETIQDTGAGMASPDSGRKMPCMKVGRASDVWSLGCILYQMAYGRTPFADLNLYQKLRSITDQSYEIPYPVAAADGQGVDPHLLDTIRRCLQRDPYKRPTIAGPEGLLSHPFLLLSMKGPVGMSSQHDESPKTIRQAVQETLRMIERQPEMIKLPTPQRLDAVCQRVMESLSLPLMSPPLPLAPPQPQQALPTNSMAVAAPPLRRAQGMNLQEQIQTQIDKLRKAPDVSRRMHHKGLQSPVDNPSDLRSVLNKAFNERFQHVVLVGEGEETETSQSMTNQQDTWS